MSLPITSVMKSAICWVHTCVSHDCPHAVCASAATHGPSVGATFTAGGPSTPPQSMTCTQSSAAVPSFKS